MGNDITTHSAKTHCERPFGARRLFGAPQATTSPKNVFVPTLISYRLFVYHMSHFYGFAFGLPCFPITVAVIFALNNQETHGFLDENEMVPGPPDNDAREKHLIINLLQNHACSLSGGADNEPGVRSMIRYAFPTRATPLQEHARPCRP